MSFIEVHPSVAASPRSRAAVLWSFARPHRWALALSLGLGIAGAGVELVSPLATRSVLDSLGLGGNFAGPLVVLISLLVVGAAMSCWQAIVLGTLAENVVYDTRRDMIGRYLRAKLLPLLQRPTGELVTRVTSDTLLLREAASSSIVGVVNGVIMLVGTLVMMFVLDVGLALTTLAAVAAIGAVTALLMPSIASAQNLAQSSLGSLGGALENTLRAIRTVKVATAESRQEETLLRHAADSRQHSLRAVRTEAIVWSVGWAGVQAATIIVLCFGAWRVSTGELTLSTLVAFLLYVVGLLGPVTELSHNLTNLQAGVAAAGRIRDMHWLVPEASPSSAHHAEFNPAAPAVELQDVHLRYQQNGPNVLEGISLSIPSQGHTAIVGPSGAGKTSLFSLLLGFVSPAQGQLILAGVPYERLPLSMIRSRLGYVEQDTPTLPGTLRENLTFADPDATDSELWETLVKVRLDDFARGLPQGLDTPLEQTTISGGQRQRIAIARALLGSSKIFLLDEATAQIDGLSEAAIHDIIQERSRAGAVVTIAHRLSTVIDADRIIVMDAGRISARGTHRELMETSPLYRSLVHALAIDRSAVHPAP